MKYYAGIGSRETPDNVLLTMGAIASRLEELGWTLRSGGADGADIAFERGVKRAAMKQIFLPWSGYNGRTAGPGVHARFESFEIETNAMLVAKHHHPNWDACKQGVRRMHTRNVLQIMGPELDTLSSMVICWTPNGSGSGGTGQAIRIAHACDVPVFDLGNGCTEVLTQIEDYLETLNQGEN